MFVPNSKTFSFFTPQSEIVLLFQQHQTFFRSNNWLFWFQRKLWKVKMWKVLWWRRKTFSLDTRTSKKTILKMNYFGFMAMKNKIIECLEFLYDGNENLIKFVCPQFLSERSFDQVLQFSSRKLHFSLKVSPRLNVFIPFISIRFLFH